MKRRNPEPREEWLNRVEPPGRLGWALYRTTTCKTTWKLRLVLAALLLVLTFATRGWWSRAIERGLVSQSGHCRPDAILVDNLVSDYVVFEKAGELMKLDGAGTALVPVRSWAKHPDRPDPVAGEITQVMIRRAGLRGCRLLPFRQVEPFTLHVARRVGRFLASHREIRSVLVVTEALRSRRTRLVYGRILGKLGVAVYTYPVWGSGGPGAWAATWHGRQEVLLQYLKLLYYEFVVL